MTKADYKMLRSVDDELWRRAKAQAALEGKTMGQFVQEAIQQYLEREWTKKK